MSVHHRYYVHCLFGMCTWWIMQRKQTLRTHTYMPVHHRYYLPCFCSRWTIVHVHTRMDIISINMLICIYTFSCTCAHRYRDYRVQLEICEIVRTRHVTLLNHRTHSTSIYTELIKKHTITLDLQTYVQTRMNMVPSLKHFEYLTGALYDPVIQTKTH